MWKVQVVVTNPEVIIIRLYSCIQQKSFSKSAIWYLPNNKQQIDKVSN